ncbi:ribosylglycohydrolase [Nitrincola sp. A-D6]|uniref:ADP-ribosylglycohydrolase family protein n=1 Tax=Nitrincola sp. A-D6 TaxID=1545442 RepID=UPI00051F9725|nr:ADP-ribosylglycohydrolase family protein [Nitrincola sp. A-D6]KGK40928.1 ribosylglycohydrolase [Nitrincola sp. A-D6]
MKQLKRAQGCLMGQLAGDALGSLVEFQDAQTISKNYPNGVRELVSGGTWNTLAGQPTDDSEMALDLARMLVKLGRYDDVEAYNAYQGWIDSGPFDCGLTISDGLKGVRNVDSQANGALMRVSPLGIFTVESTDEEIIDWAMQDAALTHPHQVCQQANALFVLAIARTIQQGLSATNVYKLITSYADHLDVDFELKAVINDAAFMAPSDYIDKQGWVLIAFQNALWQLLHAPNFEEALVDTVGRGGDTDTNAAICGALLGAVYGIDAIPGQWLSSILQCRAAKGLPGVHRPRPERYWPVDALDLAAQLLPRQYEKGGIIR